jgi:hypothetical protein
MSDGFGRFSRARLIPYFGNYPHNGKIGGLYGPEFPEGPQAGPPNEEGWSDRPKDPCGATRFSVTQRVHDAFRRNRAKPRQKLTFTLT